MKSEVRMDVKNSLQAEAVGCIYSSAETVQAEDCDSFQLKKKGRKRSAVAV